MNVTHRTGDLGRLRRETLSTVRAAAICLLIGASGCGLLEKREKTPELIPATSYKSQQAAEAMASGVQPVAGMQPVEPVSAPQELAYTPPRSPAACVPATPAPPTWNCDQQLEATGDELRNVRDRMRAMDEKHQATATTLEKLLAERDADRNRLTAIESQLAAQSTLLQELKVAATRQQEETWHALDTISNSLDRILQDTQPPETLPAVESQTPAVTNRPSWHSPRTTR